MRLVRRVSIAALLVLVLGAGAARAEKTLGPRFDVRDFHAMALENGSVPLAVLEKLVNEWIAARAKQA